MRRFAVGTPRRLEVGQRLRRLHSLATGTGHVRRFVVFGSFVTVKPEPDDVDVFMIMDDSFDVAAVTGEVRLVFDHAVAQSYLGASVFWIRQVAALDGENAAVEYWQAKRDGTQRGIVEVVDDDPERS